jgi:hypothetical protein
MIAPVNTLLITPSRARRRAFRRSFEAEQPPRVLVVYAAQDLVGQIDAIDPPAPLRRYLGPRRIVEILVGGL